MSQSQEPQGPQFKASETCVVSPEEGVWVSKPSLGLRVTSQVCVKKHGLAWAQEGKRPPLSRWGRHPNSLDPDMSCQVRLSRGEFVVLAQVALLLKVPVV